jgi:hypothetical protein
VADFEQRVEVAVVADAVDEAVEVDAARDGTRGLRAR